MRTSTIIYAVPVVSLQILGRRVCVIQLRKVVVVTFIPSSVSVQRLQVRVTSTVHEDTGPCGSKFVRAGVKCHVAARTFIVVPIVRVVIRGFSNDSVRTGGAYAINSRRRRVVLYLYGQASECVEGPIVRKVCLPFKAIGRGCTI